MARELILSLEFWLAMGAATLLKLRASPKITPLGAVATTVTAVASALVFTEPLMAYIEIDGGTYTYAVSALIALTGEHIARQVLSLSIADVVRIWRGGKK